MPPLTRRQPIQPTKTSRDTNRPAKISPNPQHASSRSNQRSLAARTAAGDQSAVQRVHALPEDMVIRVGHHHRLWQIGLDIEHGTEATQRARDGFIGRGWVVGETDPS